MLPINRLTYLYIISVLICLVYPSTNYGQSNKVSVDYSVNINDSMFGHKILDALITSNFAGFADLDITFVKGENDTITICKLNRLQVNSGFTNISIDPSKIEFRDKEIQTFYLATGHFPPGNYRMFAVLRSENLHSISQTIRLTSEFNLKMTTRERTNIISKKNQIKLCWDIKSPKTLKESISYHLMIAQVSDYRDARRPITQLKGFQWVPDIKTDSISVNKLPVKLKPNQFYTYYVEAYYNNVRIAESPKKIFLNKRVSSNNPLSKITRLLLPSKQYNDLQKLMQDTGKVSSVKKTQSPMGKYISTNLSDKIKFYGSAKLETQISNIAVPSTQIPPNYARLYLNPGVQVDNLPIVSNIFLTTENSTIYKLNSFSINFDIQKYKDNQLNAFKVQNLDIGNIDQYSSAEKKALLIQKDLLTKQISSLETQIEQKGSSLEDTKPPVIPSVKNIGNDAKMGNQLSDSLNKNNSSQQLQGPNKSQTKDSSAMVQKDASKADKSLQDSISKSKKDFNRLKKEEDSLKQFNQNSAASMVTKNKSLDSAKNQVNILKQKLAVIESTLERFQKQANNLKTPDKKDIFMDLEKYMPGNKTLNKIFSYVDHFNIGRNYPYFSDLSLSGIAVNGCSVGLSNKNLYANAVAGNALTYNPNLPQSKDFITGIKAGFGKEAGDHIAISIVNIDPAGGGAYLKNQVLTGEIQYIFFQNVKIIGDINKSFTSGATPDELPLSTKLTGISDLFKDDGNTAYSIKAQYSNPKLQSKFLFSYSVIESGYISEASPFIRTGVSEYEFKYDQSLFKKIVTLSAFYRTYTDSLSKTAPATTNFESYGLSGNIKIKHLPIISFSICPYRQTSAASKDSAGSNNTTNSIMENASAIYNFKLKGASFNTTASCLWITTENNVLGFGYKTSNYSISEQAMFKNGAFISIAGTIVNTPGMLNNFVDYHASIGGVIKNKWSNSLNGDIDISNGEYLSKYVLAWQSSYVLSSKFSIQLRVGQNYFYNLDQSGSSKQYFANYGVIYNFR